MPSTTSFSSSSASSTAISQLGDMPDKRTTIVAIILCVLGLIAIAIIMIWTYRFKPRPPLNTSSPLDNDLNGLQSRRARRAPSAGRIIPFGSEAPRFNHTPGQGMRIAERSTDGSWKFSESTTSLVPKGVSDLDHVPSPISPSTPSSLLSPIPAAKVAESKKIDDWRLTLGLTSDDFDINPPPAYRKEYVGYIDHGKN